MSNNNSSNTGKNDDENLEDLIDLYTTEKDIDAALQEKEDEQPEDVGVLVKGFPNPQRELDLHGFSVPEALFELQKFIEQAIHHKIRTVRVITGKGLHSKNMVAVMPEEVEKKLSILRKSSKVLSFKREKTGGSFAVYLIS